MRKREQSVARNSICGLVLGLLVPATCVAQARAVNAPIPSWETGPTGTQVSFRGISALDSTNVWLSGAEGTVLKSADGGSTWQDVSPPGFAEIDFRCICLLSRKVAIVASAGTPAVILRTDDAGESWEEVYSHRSPQAFFDSIRFWDSEHGIAQSDPVDGRLLVVETDDGGRTWERIATDLLPESGPSEAAFAASNRSMTLGDDGQVWIGTGGTDGKTCRVYYRRGWGKHFEVLAAPLTSGPSQGIFALEHHKLEQSSLLIAVGGDYRQNKPELKDQFIATTCRFSRDSGRTWLAPSQPPGVYQSCVVAAKTPNEKSAYISTGPIRSHIAYDADLWSAFPGGFHALVTHDSGVFACGANGRFARLVWDEE